MYKPRWNSFKGSELNPAATLRSLEWSEKLLLHQAAAEGKTPAYVIDGHVEWAKHPSWDLMEVARSEMNHLRATGGSLTIVGGDSADFLQKNGSNRDPKP